MGKTIGIDQRYLTEAYFGHAEINEVFQRGVEALEALGATVVPCDTGDVFEYGNDEFLGVLIAEFKVHVAEYLAGLRHTSMRTLADLIAFNAAHCEAEMRYYGQEIFEMAEATSGDLTDPAYLAAREKCLLLSRTFGIDPVLAAGVDAVVAPSYSFASTPAAVAGYPNVAIPIGLTADGKPAGMWMYAGFLEEPKLLAFAYALEQLLQPRRAPEYVGSLQPFPPDPGLCSAPPSSSSLTHGLVRGRHIGTGRVFERHSRE